MYTRLIVAGRPLKAYTETRTFRAYRNSIFRGFPLVFFFEFNSLKFHLDKIGASLVYN